MTTATIIRPIRPALAPKVSVRAIHDDADLVRAQQRLQVLWGSAPGTKAGDEMLILADLIEAYEARHHPAPTGSTLDVLHALMDGNGLTQSDLPEIGSQGVVSMIMNGQRQLNLRQIKALSQRFGVPAATFV